MGGDSNRTCEPVAGYADTGKRAFQKIECSQ
jgi:hypothetical protein